MRAEPVVTIKFTDASIAAIVAHVEKQLSRSDLVTLTRLQILTLLEALNERG